MFETLKSAATQGISQLAMGFIGRMGAPPGGFTGSNFCDFDIASEPPVSENEKPVTSKPDFVFNVDGTCMCCVCKKY